LKRIIADLCIDWNIKNGYTNEEIKDFFQFLQNFCINLEFNWIPKAVEFRALHKNKDLSYADCLGYIIARQLNIKGHTNHYLAY